MAQFTVVAPDGQEYGPCDLDTLRQWIREGRIVASTPIRKNGAVAVAAEFLPETAAAFRMAGSGSPPPIPPVPPLPPLPDLPPASVMSGATPTEFRVWDIIGQAWDLVRPHMVPLAVMCGLTSLVGLIPVVGGVLVLLLTGPLYLVLFRTMLGVIDGTPPRIDSLFQLDARWGQALLAYLATTLATGLGMLLCVVPGLMLATMWSMTLPCLAERSTDDFWAAMKRSADLTRGYRMRIFLLYLAFIPLMLLGLLALVVGIFVAAAVVLMSLALVYRFLLAQEAARGGAVRA